jgi:excisionase family DNA binding protein
MRWAKNPGGQHELRQFGLIKYQLYNFPYRKRRGVVSHDQDAIPGWITTAEAARKLNITQRRIRQLIDEGDLQARKIANRWFVSEDSLDAFVRGRRDRDG